MQLAAGGSNRNQDEKIVLLFPDRIECLQAALATLGTTEANKLPRLPFPASEEIIASWYRDGPNR